MHATIVDEDSRLQLPTSPALPLALTLGFWITDNSTKYTSYHEFHHSTLCYVITFASRPHCIANGSRLLTCLIQRKSFAMIPVPGNQERRLHK